MSGYGWGIDRDHSAHWQPAADLDLSTQSPQTLADPAR